MDSRIKLKPGSTGPSLHRYSTPLIIAVLLVWAFLPAHAAAADPQQASSQNRHIRLKPSLYLDSTHLSAPQRKDSGINGLLLDLAKPDPDEIVTAPWSNPALAPDTATPGSVTATRTDLPRGYPHWRLLSAVLGFMCVILFVVVRYQARKYASPGKGHRDTSPESPGATASAAMIDRDRLLEIRLSAHHEMR